MIKKWLTILRAYSWPASLVPVALGSTVAWKNGAFSIADLALTAAAALCVHSAANLANTYFDFKRGVDKKNTSDDRALVDGLTSTAAVLYTSAGLFAAAAALGLLLAFKNGVPALLWLGAGGFVLAWFYTAGGSAYKYAALGEAGIFLAFGPLLVTGTALIQSRAFLPEALWNSIPMGLLIAAILHANNMRDSGSDAQAGCSTLAGLLGPGGSLKFYYALIFSPCLFPLASGSVWPPVFCALSLPLSVKLARLAAAGELPRLVRETTRLAALYGLLLCAGLYIAA